MSSEKIILFTNSDSIYKLFETFQNLNKYVLCIVDENSSFKIFLDMPIYNTLDEVFEKYSKNYQIVVSDNCFDLIRNYNIDFNNVINFRMWFIKILKTKNIIQRPKNVRFDICTRCQLNCVDCYMRVNNDGEQGIGYLNFEQFKKFVDNNSYIQTIEISNSGEVFLNPDFVKIIEYAYNNGIVITIENGVNFNTVSEEIIEALVKYQVYIISFSIDGASDEIYSLYRRNGNYTKVIDNIKLLLKYKEKYDSELPYLSWQYILMEENECDVEKAIEQAGQLGINIEFKKDWRGTYRPKNPEKICLLTGLSYEKSSKEEIKYFYQDCIQLLVNPQINWDGNIFGCCINYRYSWKLNVLNDGLVKCLNSAYYRNAIYRLLGDKEAQVNDDPCTKCYFFIEDNYLLL